MVLTAGRVAWVLQVIVAVILLQTLYFKFTGAPESVHIFSRLGVEPWGRIGSGVVELVASLLLLTPSLSAVGASIAIAVMAGAILGHLAVLGIEVQGDGGLLFGLAIIVLVASIVIFVIRRAQLQALGVTGTWVS